MTSLSERIAAEAARRPVLSTDPCPECNERTRHAIRCGFTRNAHDLFLIGALLTGLIALFIAGMGVLRVLEHISPRFSSWLDQHLEPGIWDD